MMLLGLALFIAAGLIVSIILKPWAEARVDAMRLRRRDDRRRRYYAHRKNRDR